MQGNRRHGEAAQRFAERRQRENDAPRLSTEVPELASLRLEVEESSGGTPVAEPKYVRRVVVEHAPALFLLGCGDPRCKEGGHDVTHVIMRSLRNRELHFKGDDGCGGLLGTSQCTRTIHFEAMATYRDA